jgi:hypothetical protein
MSSPYSGSTGYGSTGYGANPGDTQSIPTVPSPEHGNYAVAPEHQAQHYAGDLGTPLTDAGRPDVERSSVGELIGEVTRDLSTLMRQELELAKAELKVEAKKAGQGAGMFGAAGFAGYMTLLFLSIALWWALENVMDAGLAALIVAVIWAVIGAVTYTAGRKRFREVNPKPERTVETLQQVPDAFKPH